MIGIEVMAGLIILEASGLGSVADSVSYWFLNDMLLMISFDMNSPRMMFWNESWGERSAGFWNIPLPEKYTGPCELRTKVQHGKAWKGTGNSLIEFSSHHGE